MNIAIAQTRGAGRIHPGAIKKLVSFFLQKATRRTGIRWGDISILLANDRESQRINKAHLGHDYETDVISFNFDPVPGDSDPLSHGEIVVNVEYAQRMGRRYAGGDREVALYLAHGCDHLSGEDDATPATRLRMRRRELRWLSDAKAQGLSFRLTGGATLPRQPPPRRHSP